MLYSKALSNHSVQYTSTGSSIHGMFEYITYRQCYLPFWRFAFHWGTLHIFLATMDKHFCKKQFDAVSSESKVIQK